MSQNYGFTNEDRQEFQYVMMGSWVKEIVCGRCGSMFEVKDEKKLTFGPLLGRPQPPEVTWE